VREEYEHPVTKKEFKRHKREHIGTIIEKFRYVFEYRGHTYEMDRFLGVLKGLVFVEVEFGEEVEARAFVLPAIFDALYVADVTDDRRYTNAALSREGRVPSLESGLEALEKRIDTVLSPYPYHAEEAFAPYDTTMKVLQTMLREMVEKLENERIVLLHKSDDMEALHRFRVSLRRVRSIIGLFRESFQPHWYHLHRRNLALLMEQTNRRRDADVFLERLPQFQQKLSSKQAKGIAALGRLIEKEKREQDLRIEAMLEGELLRYEIDTLARPRFLPSLPTQPIVITSIQIWEKALQAVLSKGRALDAHSKEHAYHRMRIALKKSRYTIEALESLANPQRLKQVSKEIKTMQTILGDFHDYQVESLFLRTLQEEIPSRKKKLHRTIEGLLKLLAASKKREEKRFRKTFKRFDRKRKRLRRLFEAC
jgi:CHAD domain-containing protein